LVRARYPHLSATEVIHRMTATAIDKGPPGRDDEYGYGIVNPVAALTANVPPLSPSAAPTSPSSGVDASSQALPPARRGVNPWLVVAAVVLLLIGAVATWLLIQDRARGDIDAEAPG
ncbi:MAG TPA: peptidase s8 and s53 subtilisin kexin sedolisin, partial [Micromonosporaceae bacterium]